MPIRFASDLERKDKPVNTTDGNGLGNDPLRRLSAANAIERRDFIQGVAAASLVFLLPAGLSAQLFNPSLSYAFKCLGHRRGPRYLDGRTKEGTVGLAPELSKYYSGTKWSVVKVREGVVALKCLGLLEGPARWLDGRTHEGKVGLAPNTRRPYTGTTWQVIPADENVPTFVWLKCLGHVDGPRYLDGRTHDGTVWLAPGTNAPYTGTKWEVVPYPIIQGEPFGIPG